MTVYFQFAEKKMKRKKFFLDVTLLQQTSQISSVRPGSKHGFAPTASNIIPSLKRHQKQFIVALRIEDHDVQLLRKMKMSGESLDQGMNRSYDSS